MSLVCGFHVEREKARADTAVPARDSEREPPKRPKPSGTEYRCGARWRTRS